MTERLQRTSYDIRFEPSWHAISEIPLLDDPGLADRFAAGDFEARVWDPRLPFRMREYNPRLVCLEQTAPTILDTTYKALPPDYIRTWFYMPDIPSRITDAPEIFVLGADSFAELQFNPVGTNLFNQLEDKIKHDYFTSLLHMTRGFSMEETMMLAATLTTLTAVARRKDEEGNPRSVTRRDVLKTGLKSLIGVTALSTAKALAPFPLAFLAGKAPNEGLKDAMLDTAEALGADKNYSDYMAARNAMLILKTKDAMTSLGLEGETASIVAGDLHGLGFDNLVEDEEECGRVLRLYTSQLFEKIDEYAQNTSEDPAILKLLLAAYLVKSSVQRLVDIYPHPGMSQPEYNGVLAGGIIEEGIVPSRRSFEAIEPLTHKIVRQIRPETIEEF